MDILNLLLSVQLILLVASALCFIYFRRRLKKIKQHYDSLNEARKQGIEGKIAIFEQNLNNISAVLNSKLDTYTNTLESELNSYRNLINNAKLELVSNISSYHPVDNFVRCSRVYEKGNPLATSFFKLIERLSCKSVANGEYIRIGRRNDGGYVMLNEFDGKIAAYSFGICDDVSWDSDIASRNIPCYMYDHTIEALPAVGGSPLFNWKKTGVCGSKPIADCKTLTALINENSHATSQDLILKMDVEGAEWAVIENTTVEVFNQFSQIVMEMHWLTEPAKTDMYVRCFDKLNKTHQLVFVHANNWADYCVVGNKILPSVIEVLWIRRKDHGFTDYSKNVEYLYEPCRSTYEEIPGIQPQQIDLLDLM